MQVHKTHDSCKATKIHIKLYSMHTALVLHGQDDPTMIFTRSSQVIPKLTGIQVGPTHVGPPSSNSMLWYSILKSHIPKIKSHLPKIEE